MSSWIKCLSNVFVFALLFSSQLVADDWSQWLGSNRDSLWNESGILTKFPKEGPKIKWRVPVSMGYAGPAVVGKRVLVCDFVVSEGTATNNPGKRDKLKGKERLLCLDAETGKQLWEYQHEELYSISYPGGPRCTPTVDGDRVYILGAEGHLACVSLEDGKEQWSKELKSEYKIEEAPIWGFAGHPLVHGDTLFCLVGGQGSVAVAFDKMTGKEKWKALSAKEPGYCPPTMINAGGTDQLLIWHSEKLNSLDPKTGKVYWSFELAPSYAMSIIAPIKSGDYLLATALQNKSLLLKLDDKKPAATEVWRDMGIHPDHNPLIIHEGHLYGVDVKGHFRCIHLESGKRVWESMATTPNGRPQNSATGFVVRNGKTWYIANETGDLIIAEVSPKGFNELDRAHMLDTTSRSFGRQVVWSHPAFANKCVFARNDKEIVCVSMAK